MCRLSACLPVGMHDGLPLLYVTLHEEVSHHRSADVSVPTSCCCSGPVCSIWVSQPSVSCHFMDPHRLYSPGQRDMSSTAAYHAAHAKAVSLSPSCAHALTFCHPHPVTSLLSSLNKASSQTLPSLSCALPISYSPAHSECAHLVQPCPF